MTDSTCAIGIDLGGTRIKGGIVDAARRITHLTAMDTQAEGGPDHVINRIVSLIGALRAHVPDDNHPPVGIGSPGSLNRRRGLVINPPNLPGWTRVPLVDNIQNAIGVAVVLENDANAAAWGEYAALRDAEPDLRDMTLLTLGTGVGGGLIIDGRLHGGPFESAGELGHTIVVPDGRPCACGQRGCLEAYASATQIVARVNEARRAEEADVAAIRSAEEVAAAVRAGDSVASRIWDEACRYLAVTCINLRHLLNPRVIVLGGGLSEAGDLIIEPVRRYARGMAWGDHDEPELRIAQLGNDAGVIGVGMLALDRRNEPIADASPAGG
jgi:glucokinase